MSASKRPSKNLAPTSGKGSKSKKQTLQVPKPKSQAQVPRPKQLPADRPQSARGSANGSASSVGAVKKRLAFKRAGPKLTSRQYRRLWNLAKAPRHLHPPAPTYNGPEDTHKYLHYDSETAVTVSTVAPGELAILFYDENEQMPTLARGSWVRTVVSAYTDLSTNYLMRDMDNFRLTADFVRAQVPQASLQVRALTQVAGTGTTLNAIPDAPTDIDANDQYAKVQRMLTVLTAQVSVPFGGACTTSVLSAGTRHEFCGDRSRRVHGDRNENSTSTSEEDPYLRTIYKVPNVASGTAFGSVQASCSTVVQMGASDTATMTHDLTLQHNDGWFNVGRLETYTPGSTANVKNGCHPSNLLYEMCQGCMIFDNTGSDPITVLFRGKSNYALTQANFAYGAGSSLVTTLLNQAAFMTQSPAHLTGDDPTHSHKVGAAPSVPPRGNAVVVPDHNNLASDIEQGAAAFGIGKLIEESGAGAAAWNAARSLAGKVATYSEKYLPSIIEEVGMML